VTSGANSIVVWIELAMRPGVLGFFDQPQRALPVFRALDGAPGPQQDARDAIAAIVTALEGPLARGVDAGDLEVAGLSRQTP
jgi:hypothetical protein